MKRIVYLGLLAREHTGNDFMDTADDVGKILGACPERIQTGLVAGRVCARIGECPVRDAAQSGPEEPGSAHPELDENEYSLIGIADLVDYLVRAQDVDAEGTTVADIGLPPMSLREMLLATSRAMGLKRIFIPVPFSLPRCRLSSSC